MRLQLFISGIPLIKFQKNFILSPFILFLAFTGCRFRPLICGGVHFLDGLFVNFSIDLVLVLFARFLIFIENFDIFVEWLFQNFFFSEINVVILLNIVCPIVLKKKYFFVKLRKQWHWFHQLSLRTVILLHPLLYAALLIMFQLFKFV